MSTLQIVNLSAQNLDSLIKYIKND